MISRAAILMLSKKEYDWEGPWKDKKKVLFFKYIEWIFQNNNA